MQSIIKTANRFDSLWTTVVMLPAFIMLMNAGINLHQGKASPADFGIAAKGVITQFAGQYTPYVETTGKAIVTGVEKLSDVAASCVTGSNGPIYLTAGMAHRNGCNFGNKVAGYSPIKAYRIHY